jgi:hypothetical protein
MGLLSLMGLPFLICSGAILLHLFLCKGHLPSYLALPSYPTSGIQVAGCREGGGGEVNWPSASGPLVSMTFCITGPYTVPFTILCTDFLCPDLLHPDFWYLYLFFSIGSINHTKKIYVITVHTLLRSGIHHFFLLCSVYPTNPHRSSICLWTWHRSLT